MSHVLSAIGCGAWLGLCIGFIAGYATPTVASSAIMAGTLFLMSLVNALTR